MSKMVGYEHWAGLIVTLSTISVAFSRSYSLDSKRYRKSVRLCNDGLVKSALMFSGVSLCYSSYILDKYRAELFFLLRGAVSAFSEYSLGRLVHRLDLLRCLLKAPL